MGADGADQAQRNKGGIDIADGSAPGASAEVVANHVVGRPQVFAHHSVSFRKLKGGYVQESLQFRLLAEGIEKKSDNLRYYFAGSLFRNQAGLEAAAHADAGDVGFDGGPEEVRFAREVAKERGLVQVGELSDFARGGGLEAMACEELG